MNKNFNIVIVGTGGQGLITLNKILAVAATKEGFDVKTSELHGLSQRGGSVETHIRFGKKIFSPLVKEGGADLVISLESQEAFRACYYSSSKKTVFLINDYIVPIPTDEKKSESLKNTGEIKKFSKEILLIPATKIVEKEFQNPVLAGIYLLGVAVSKKLIPLKIETVVKAIKEVVSPKYLNLNQKAFELARYQ